MKKHTTLKRLFSLALALIMALSLATTAMASGTATPPPYEIDIVPNEYTSTPDDSNADDSLKTRYWAYQIFAGDIDSGYAAGTTAPTANALTNVKWGKSVESISGLLVALMNDKTKLSEVGINASVLAQLTFDKSVYGEDYVPTADTTLGAIYNKALTTAGYAVTGNAGNCTAIAAGTTGDSAFANTARLVLQVLNDLMTRSNGQVINNAALAQAFADIVAQRWDSKDPNLASNIPGDYKYLKNNGGDAYGAPSSGDYKGAYAVSTWDDTDTTHHWKIGDKSNTNQNKDYLAGGYYLIRDMYEEGHKTTDKANSKFIVSVLGSTTVNVKSDAPDVTKEIVNYTHTANGTTGTGNAKGDSAATNEDTIIFQLTGSLPENYDTAYDHYKYIFHDTLDEGLTYTGAAAPGYIRVYVIKPAAAPAVPEIYLLNPSAYSVNTSTNHSNPQGADTFDVSFADLMTVTSGEKVNALGDAGTSPDYDDPIKIDSDWTIIVQYTAKLNNKAITGKYGADHPNTPAHNGQGAGGNQNTAYLEYSNDPNWEPLEQDKTWADAPTGYTSNSTSTVYNYTYGIEITKVDGSKQENNKLQGAGFVLTKQDPQGGYPYYASNAANSQPEGYISEADLLAYLGESEIGSVDWSTATDDGKVTNAAAGSGAYTGPNIQNKYLWLSGESAPSPVEPVTYYAVFTKVNDASSPNNGELVLYGWYDESGLIGLGFKDGSGGLDLKATVTGYTLVLTTDVNGNFEVRGLDEGTYTLTEVVTPDGFDTMPDVQFTITPTISAGTSGETKGELAKLEASTTAGMADAQIADNDYKETGIIPITLINYPGMWAPGTGGMGTTLFYIVGGVLLAGAAALLFLSNQKKGKYAQ